MSGTPTVTSSVLDYLKADPTLAMLLPGGLYDRDLKRQGPGATRDAYAPDPPHQPRPAAVVVDDGDDASLTGADGCQLGFLSLWCYAPTTASGRAAIAEAIDRARVLLVGFTCPTGNGAGARIEQPGQRLGVRDDPVDDGRVVDRIRFLYATYWPRP
jgi:hypothetical protein